jgi:hypothetical protein
MDDRTFGKAVVRKYPSAEKRRVTRDGQRFYAYAGIRLREDAKAGVSDEPYQLEGFPWIAPASTSVETQISLDTQGLHEEVLN